MEKKTISLSHLKSLNRNWSLSRLQPKKPVQNKTIFSLRFASFFLSDTPHISQKKRLKQEIHIEKSQGNPHLLHKHLTKPIAPTVDFLELYHPNLS